MTSIQFINEQATYSDQPIQPTQLLQGNECPHGRPSSRLAQETAGPQRLSGGICCLAYKNVGGGRESSAAW